MPAGGTQATCLGDRLLQGFTGGALQSTDRAQRQLSTPKQSASSCWILRVGEPI